MKSYLTCHSRPHFELYFLRLSGGAIEHRRNSECYTIQDASGLTVAWLFCRDDTKRYSVGASKPTSEEARRIGKAISRIPEFMIQRQGFTRVGEDRDGAPTDQSPSWSRGSSPPASATLAFVNPSTTRYSNEASSRQIEFIDRLEKEVT